MSPPTVESLRIAVSSTLTLAAKKWRRASHSILTAYNVSEACAVPLLCANRLGDGVRQVALADAIGIEGPSLVRLLDQLCAAGLARRDDDPDDKRAKTITVTPAGRAVTEKMEADLVMLRGEVLKGITRADLDVTLRVLQAFTAFEAADAAKLNRDDFE